MTVIRDVQLREVKRPLRTTFSTSLGQKQRLRSIMVRVALDGGASGLGEVPTSLAFKDETTGVARRVLEESTGRIRGSSIDEYGPLVDRLRTENPHAFMTISGLELALFRALLSARGCSEQAYWGNACPLIETDITIPFFTDRRRLMRWIDWTISRGFRIYKLKMSGHVQGDRLILSLLHGILKERVPGFRLRLDANQGYTARTFLDMLRYIEENGLEIELFEQPLRKDDFRGFEEIRAYASIPIILDETILNLRDARRAVDNGLCDGVNIKLAKSGVAESLKIAELARQNHMKLMIGCMTETMVGLSAAIFFAAGTGFFDFIDLDSIHLLFGKNRWPGLALEGPSFVIGGDGKARNRIR